MDEEKKEIRRRIRESLEQLAFGSVNDAIRLLFCEDPDMRTLRRLNLFSVAEVRRPKGGGMEIKFVDRMEALQCLKEFCEQEDDDRERLLPFYQALEENARILERQEAEPS